MVSFPLTPERGARLLVAAMRSLGDVAGHEFHGNQWTDGSGATQEFHHGTSSNKLTSIREKGLLASKAGEQYQLSAVKGSGVFIADNHDDAAVWAKSTAQQVGWKSREPIDAVVLRVQIPIDHPALTQDPHSSGFKFTADIKPEWIKGVSKLDYATMEWRELAAGSKTKTLFIPLILSTESQLRAAAKHASPIQAAALAHEPKLSVAFRHAFAMGRKALGKPPDAERAVEAIVSALESTLRPTLLKAATAGGEAALSGLKGLRHAAAGDKATFKMRFDASNQNVVDWADQHAAELIDGITETSREAINNAVAAHAESGDWEEFYDEILSAVGDTARADLMAQHESMLAASEGQRLGWDQAVEKGLLTGDEERAWILTEDNKVCPICEGLADTKASLDGSYEFDGETYDGPPAHVGCRCTEGIA